MFWSQTASKSSCGRHLHAEFLTLTETAQLIDCNYYQNSSDLFFLNQCGTNRLQKGASVFVFQMKMEPQGGSPLMNDTYKPHLA